MKVNRGHIKPPRVEMLPLIDIVFLLLVVFIYTMLSMAVHKGMAVQLPTGEQIQVEKEAPLSISISAEGEVFVNKTLVALDHLTARLESYASVDKEKGVLLFADQQVSYQRVFEVLDRIRQAGLHRISLQAEAKP